MKFGLRGLIVFLGAAGLTAGLASPAFSDLIDELEECSTVRDVEKRAACYDVLAIRYASDRKPKSKVSGSRWKIKTALSPITDTRNVYLHLPAEKSILTDVFGEARPKLLVQCVDGVTSGALNWEFIVGGGTVPIVYRVDDGPPVTTDIRISDDFRSIISWGKERTVNFIKSLFGKKRLAVQITPISQPPVVAEFNITGIEKAVEPLRKSCGW